MRGALSICSQLRDLGETILFIQRFCSLTCEMGQWLNHQVLLLDFGLQFIFRSPHYSFRFPAALEITSQECVQPDDKRLKCGGWELRAPAVPLFSSGLNTRQREKGGPKGWDPGGREFRRVPWSWTERAFGRATHGSYISSANAFHAARDSRKLRSARHAGEAEFPARRTPLPLHAAENPRPQVPPGREVLHRLLALTSANSPASPQLGMEDRPYF